MLSFQDRLSRRSFLQVGACGLSGLGLSQLMAAAGEDDPGDCFPARLLFSYSSTVAPANLRPLIPRCLLREVSVV